MKSYYHGYPPGWIALSARMREAVGQCEACFVREDQHGHPSGRRLAVDHVDGNTWNLRKGNLVVLCSRCHMTKTNLAARRRFTHREEVIGVLRRRLDAARAQLKLRV